MNTKIYLRAYLAGKGLADAGVMATLLARRAAQRCDIPPLRREEQGLWPAPFPSLSPTTGERLQWLWRGGGPRSGTGRALMEVTRAEGGAFAGPQPPAFEVQEGPEIGTLWGRDLEEAAHGEGGVGAAELAGWIAGPRGLSAFGAVCAGEVLELAQRAERDASRGLPAVEHYGAWGARQDALLTSEAWVALKGCAAENGTVAEGHDPERGPRRRVLQFLKCVLFSGASAMASCPVAMTDGAATVVREFADAGDEHCRAVLSRLIARDPDMAWTSGQWMTEAGGGTDVSRATRTVAEPCPDAKRAGRAKFATHCLSGVKYFSSATDAEVSLALAREGTARGAPLSMFLVRLGPGVIPEHVRVRRLKKKLGTRALPTAELELHGCPARRLGAPGKGVKEIARMVNVTRLHNAASAASHARLAWLLCEDYARRRHVQGRPLGDFPLAEEVLAWMRAMVSGCVALTLDGASLLGRAEAQAGSSSEEAAGLLRLLTPAVKLLTAKVACNVCQEGVEFFGGAGYVEDVGVARLLRDVLVLPIWEGASNVMALDVLRVLAAPAGREAFRSVLIEARDTARAASHLPELATAADETLRRADALERLAAAAAPSPTGPGAERTGRAAAAGLAHLRASALLLARRPPAPAAAALWCSAPPPGALARL